MQAIGNELQLYRHFLDTNLQICIKVQVRALLQIGAIGLIGPNTPMFA